MVSICNLSGRRQPLLYGFDAGFYDADEDSSDNITTTVSFFSGVPKSLYVMAGYEDIDSSSYVKLLDFTNYVEPPAAPDLTVTSPTVLGITLLDPETGTHDTNVSLVSTLFPHGTPSSVTLVHDGDGHATRTVTLTMPGPVTATPENVEDYVGEFFNPSTDQYESGEIDNSAEGPSSSIDPHDFGPTDLSASSALAAASSGGATISLTWANVNTSFDSAADSLTWTVTGVNNTDSSTVTRTVDNASTLATTFTGLTAGNWAFTVVENYTLGVDTATSPSASISVNAAPTTTPSHVSGTITNTSSGVDADLSWTDDSSYLNSYVDSTSWTVSGINADDSTTVSTTVSGSTLSTSFSGLSSGHWTFSVVKNYTCGTSTVSTDAATFTPLYVVTNRSTTTLSVRSVIDDSDIHSIGIRIRLYSDGTYTPGGDDLVTIVPLSGDVRLDVNTDTSPDEFALDDGSGNPLNSVSYSVGSNGFTGFFIDAPDATGKSATFGIYYQNDDLSMTLIGTVTVTT